MKEVIQNEIYGEIVYEESFWTGKKTLTISGVAANKISKKEFRLPDGRTATVQGNFLQGACLLVESESIRLTPKIKWYEIALAIIPFLLIMVWGNVVALCEIVPVVGGAIGGGLSALFSVAGLVLIKRVKPIWLKALIALAVTGVTFGICCGIGYAILSSL
ncbi:MAG: hypothetical protein K2N23_04325 [Clostridia bacterium]|nr:hypothetical protein [Clostridia bacterium]